MYKKPMKYSHLVLLDLNTSKRQRNTANIRYWSATLVANTALQMYIRSLGNYYIPKVFTFALYMCNIQSQLYPKSNKKK